MRKITARALRNNIKLEFAAHHFVFHSKSAKVIGEVVNVAPERVCRWCQTDEWRRALRLWGYGAKADAFVEDFYDHMDTLQGHFLVEKWANLFEVPEMETVVNVPIFKRRFNYVE